MDELRLTDTSNRRVEVSQEAVVYRRPVAPVAGLVAGYLTRVVRAQVLAKLIPTGAISPIGAAKLLRLPVEQEVPAYVLTRSGVVLVEDLISGRVREIGNGGPLGARRARGDNAGRWMHVHQGNGVGTAQQRAVAEGRAMSAELTDQGQTSAPKWGDDISDDRKRELGGIVTAWEALPEAERGKRKGPFDSGDSALIMSIRRPPAYMRLTGADVFWLVARALAVQGGKGTEEDAIADEAGRLRWAQDDALLLGSDASYYFIRLDAAVNLNGAYLASALLNGAYLVSALLNGAYLESVHLSGANLKGAELNGAYLIGADLGGATLEGAGLNGAYLIGADLGGATLKGAELNGANLTRVHLERARLEDAHLEQASLEDARLEWADLRTAVLDAATKLNDAVLTGARLADLRWGGTNLTVIDWEMVPELGDEREVWALKPMKVEGKTREERAKQRAKQVRDRLYLLKAAVRANRQLATVLQDQGMNEDAAKYAERAQRLQSRVLRLQGKRGRAAWSWFLDALAGYGYRPGRTVFWYVLVVVGFAALYMGFGVVNGHAFNVVEAAVFSVTSFHGRGFFPGSLRLDDPVTVLAALEAVIGLVIEVSFIATFTQRFFGSK